MLTVDSASRRGQVFMSSVCRGAPGAALSRMFLPVQLLDPQLLREQQVALDTTATTGLSTLDHLCCGAMGRSSVLYSAAQRGHGAKRAAEAMLLAGQVIQRAAGRGRFTCSSERYEDRRSRSGFSYGWSGIGYQLLRLLGREDLPDPLALELPSEVESRGVASRMVQRLESERAAASSKSAPALQPTMPRRSPAAETTTSDSSVAIRRLEGEVPSGSANMTFPSYRHLLTLARQPRHPDLGEVRQVQPIAHGAFVGEQFVGLALSEVPVERSDEKWPPQLLSVFVKSEARRQGVAGRLVAAVEKEVSGLGFATLCAVYTTGKPGVDWMERIFRTRGYGDPEPRTLAVRYEPEKALSSPAFEERRLRRFYRGLDIFPWREVRDEELEALRAGNERRAWIEPSLAPFAYDKNKMDPTSVGARYEGEIVGWLINDRVLPHMLRTPVAYMRPDLSKRGRLMALMHAMLLRMLESDVKSGSWVTPFSYPPMIQFIRRWAEPISSFVGETRRVMIDFGEDS